MTVSFRKKLGTGCDDADDNPITTLLTPPLAPPAYIAQHISPTRGFKYARFSRVISQSSHGLYCESK
jgi:hypothetical protein